MITLRVLSVGIALLMPLSAEAVEIDGVRLGMTIEEARQAASSRGYTFSNEVHIGDEVSWKTYTLQKDGPVVSFCHNILSAVGKTYDSNLHEFSSLLKQYIDTLGSPKVVSRTTYIRGEQISSVDFNWSLQDNINRGLTVQEFGKGRIMIWYNFSFINHPCKKTARS